MISFTPSIPELQVPELTHVGCAVDFKSFPYEVLLKRNKGNACNPLVCSRECSPRVICLPTVTETRWGESEVFARAHTRLDDPASLKVSSWDATFGPRRRLSISYCCFHHPWMGLTSCPFILFCIYTILFIFSLAENLSSEAFVRYKEAALQTIIFCLPCTGLPVWNIGGTFSSTVSRR